MRLRLSWAGVEAALAMKARPPQMVRFWRSVAPTVAVRAAAVCAAFAALIAIGVYRSWPSVPGVSLVTLAWPAGPSGPFAQTRIGEIVLLSRSGQDCRRLAFNNGTGELQDQGVMACGASALQSERAKDIDRLTALKRSFQK